MVCRHSPPPPGIHFGRCSWLSSPSTGAQLTPASSERNSAAGSTPHHTTSGSSGRPGSICHTWASDSPGDSGKRTACRSGSLHVFPKSSECKTAGPQCVLAPDQQPGPALAGVDADGRHRLHGNCGPVEPPGRAVGRRAEEQALARADGEQHVTAIPHDPVRCPRTLGRWLPTTSAAPTPASRSSRSTRPTTSPGGIPTTQLGAPGQPPYTRGVYPSMYRGRLWTMRQYAGFGTRRGDQRALQVPARAPGRPACRAPSTCRRRWATTPTTRAPRARSARSAWRSTRSTTCACCSPTSRSTRSRRR